MYKYMTCIHDTTFQSLWQPIPLSITSRVFRVNEKKKEVKNDYEHTSLQALHQYANGHGCHSCMQFIFSHNTVILQYKTTPTLQTRSLMCIYTNFIILIYTLNMAPRS